MVMAAFIVIMGEFDESVVDAVVVVICRKRKEKQEG
jgi:hypothetical protein